MARAAPRAESARPVEGCGQEPRRSRRPRHDPGPAPRKSDEANGDWKEF
ncbi:MAG: hypothetical protein MZW92_54170 [Comamonadaceae bacterium]|nr:hypothetical protein [Comamonadaceae bacterium]